MTAGDAGPNPDCRYYGITDDQTLRDALVGCGGHGSHEYIRASRLKCQACQTTPALAGGAREFSVRSGPVLYRLKTPARRVGEVLSALAEGLSVGAAVRVFGYGESTIRTWLTRAGLHATSRHERLFQNLKLLHIQLDELCTKTRQGADALWVCFAVNARTTLRSHPRVESWAAHSTDGPCRRARSRERVSSRLSARFHQRWLEAVILRADRPVLTTPFIRANFRRELAMIHSAGTTESTTDQGAGS